MLENREKKAPAEKSDEDWSAADEEIRIEKEVIVKKPIAPIFACKKKLGKVLPVEMATPVVEEDPEKVAARKAFLLSSVPDALKSQVDRHRRCLQDSNDEIGGFLTPYVSHIGHVTQIQSNQGCGKYDI